MTKITDSMEMTVSPEYEAMLAVVAPAFGWYPETSLTPIQGIAQYLEERRDQDRIKVQQALMSYYGLAGTATVMGIMEAYDASITRSVTIQ